MTAELLMMKGLIASLPREDQEKVESLAQQIREIVKINPDHGPLAVALVGTEMSER